MARTFATELNQFIQDELQTGNYADEDTVLGTALEVFREVRLRHAEFRGWVQESLVHVHSGKAKPLAMDDMRQSLTNRLDRRKG